MGIFKLSAKEYQAYKILELYDKCTKKMIVDGDGDLAIKMRDLDTVLREYLED